MLQFSRAAESGISVIPVRRAKKVAAKKCDDSFICCHVDDSTMAKNYVLHLGVHFSHAFNHELSKLSGTRAMDHQIDCKY